MARLQIYLLGSFRVTLDGQPVNFGYDRVRALLAFLAVENDRPTGREKLAGLLWPDQPQVSAQDGLRQALSRLRQAIGDRQSSGDRQASPSFLLISRESLQLNPHSDIWIDLHTFRQRLTDCNTHTHRRAVTCPACTRLRRAACELYQGEFLENLSLPDSDLFEDWARLQRQALNLQVMTALHQLAVYFESQPNPNLQMEYANRQLAIDPLNEAAHCQLWRALAANGQSSLVPRRYQMLRQALSDELGIEPSKETSRLAEIIHKGEPTLPPPAEGSAPTLPGLLTPLVGRTAELAELDAWLANPSRRLITITGPGGIGKTHLALDTASRHGSDFDQGVIFVHVEAPRAEESCCNMFARLLGLSLTGSEPPETQIERFLHGKDLLLVLDSFEHADQVRPHLRHWLEHSPGVVALVTSRERLNLPGEWLFDLGGLECPPENQSNQLEKYSAAVLFLARVRQVAPSFSITEEDRSAIVKICRLTGGLPLALNLAADWIRSLSCREIAAELAKGLDLLTELHPRAGDKRFSLRAIFEQSWEMLTPEEQRVFRQTAVFQGGFDRQASVGVADASLVILASLVDHCFLRCPSPGRYDSHELLIQFGLEKLTQAGENETVRQCHFEHFLREAENNERDLLTGQPLNAMFWIAKEQANLQAALDWGLEHCPHEAQGMQEVMHRDWHSYGLHLGIEVQNFFRKP